MVTFMNQDVNLVPATDDIMVKFEQHLSKVFERKIILPQDYKEFLKMHNGATLFGNQSGDLSINLYSIDELNEFNDGVNIEKNPDEFYITIGSCDGGYIKIVLANYENNTSRESKYLYIFNYYFLEDIKLNTNFETWLDRVIITQGNVYWEW